MFGQLLLNALATGSIYALLALAMVIIYKTSDVPNFAQGEMAMLATYVTYVLFVPWGWPLAMMATLAFAVILGVGFQYLFLRRSKEPQLLDAIMITLGFQFFLHGIAGWFWGPEQRAFLFPISDTEMLTLGALRLSSLSLFTICFALVLMVGLWFFFYHTRWGTAMRACQQDLLAARACGIPIQKMLALTWGLSALVGAIAGILLAPVTSLDPALMWGPVLKGFAAAVLGGMTSLGGAVVGAYLLAISESLCGAYISVEFKEVLAFCIIVLMLWFRPKGLFGQAQEAKV